MSSAPDITYLVELTRRATRDLELLHGYVQAASSAQAAIWFTGLEAAIFSLDQNPARGTLSGANKTCRQILYGRRPNAYRIVYSVNQKRRTVTVMYIRHGARAEIPE